MEISGVRLYFSWKTSNSRPIYFSLIVDELPILSLPINVMKIYYGKKFFDKHNKFSRRKKGFYKFKIPIVIKQNSKINCGIKFFQPYSRSIKIAIVLICIKEPGYN